MYQYVKFQIYFSFITFLLLFLLHFKELVGGELIVRQLVVNLARYPAEDFFVELEEYRVTVVLCQHIIRNFNALFQVC